MIPANTKEVQDDVEKELWNGDHGTGGFSWKARSHMGQLRGVIDVADETGRRSTYIHTLQTKVLSIEISRLLRPIDRALDFGCGTGRFLRLLSSRSLALYALDRDTSMLEAARRHAGAFVRQLVEWNSERVPFSDKFFDFVLCSSVLSVTPSQLFDSSLSEMARVLRSGSTLLLFEKISVPRSLTLERYHDGLMKAGFEVIREYPIRSASSPLTALITKAPWIPRQAFALIATMELALTKRRTYAEPDPYVEYAIVARKLDPSEEGQKNAK